MIYVFDDARILQKKDLLRQSDEGHYLAVEKLPPSEYPDKQAVYYADMKDREIKIEYRDIPEPTPDPEPEPTKPPIPQATSDEVIQVIEDLKIDLMIAGVI